MSVTVDEMCAALKERDEHYRAMLKAAAYDSERNYCLGALAVLGSLAAWATRHRKINLTPEMLEAARMTPDAILMLEELEESK